MVGRVSVIALGKAAGAMMAEALLHVDAVRALVVTNGENYREVAGADVIVGEHPVPSDGSVVAGAAVLDAVAGLGPEDQVLALISGGGSALAIAPVEGVSAGDKQAANGVFVGVWDGYQPNEFGAPVFEPHQGWWVVGGDGGVGAGLDLVGCDWR